MQIIKKHPSIIWRDHPWTRFVLLDSSAGPVQSSPKTKKICNRMILNFSYCKYGVLDFGDDWTGPADESKSTKRVQGWSRQLMGGCFFIICNTITLWNNYLIRVNMHAKLVDYLYNSINRCMVQLWWSRAVFIEVRALNRSRLLQTLWVVYCMFLWIGLFD